MVSVSFPDTVSVFLQSKTLVHYNDMLPFEDTEKRKCIMTDASIHPKKFRGSMKGLFTGTDGRDYLQEIIIPGIQFFVGEQAGIPDGEETIFSYVDATVYPK